MADKDEDKKRKKAEYRRAYYEAHKEAAAERSRAYYEAHKEAIAEQRRAQREAKKAEAAEKRKDKLPEKKEIEEKKRICERCGQPFVPDSINQKYCDMCANGTQRRCEICGKLIPIGSNQRVYCSAECAKIGAKRREKTSTGKKPRHPPFKTLTCPICGKVEERPIACKLCASCQAIETKKKAAESKRAAKAGHSRHRGEKYPCEACGELYVFTGGLQKYCPDCAKIEVQKKIRAKALARYEKRKADDPDYLKKRQANRSKRDPLDKECPVCGKLFRITHDNTAQVYCSEDCSRIGYYQTHRRNKIKTDQENGVTKSRVRGTFVGNLFSQKLRKDNSTGYRGVSAVRRAGGKVKYIGQLKVQKKYYHTKPYETPEEAKEARDALMEKVLKETGLDDLAPKTKKED